MEPTSLKYPALAGGFFTTSTTWKERSDHITVHNSVTVCLLSCSRHSFFLCKTSSVKIVASLHLLGLSSQTISLLLGLLFNPEFCLSCVGPLPQSMFLTVFLVVTAVTWLCFPFHFLSYVFKYFSLNLTSKPLESISCFLTVLSFPVFHISPIISFTPAFYKCKIY